MIKKVLFLNKTCNFEQIIHEQKSEFIGQKIVWNIHSVSFY